MHKSNGDYNNDTSVYINMLNPRCTEEDIIEEVNLIFKDQRVGKDKNLTRDLMAKGEKDGD